MSQLDAKKETISFFVGVVIIILGGLISMFKNQTTDTIFWLGVISIFVLSSGCLLVFKHIQKNIKEIEKL